MDIVCCLDDDDIIVRDMTGKLACLAQCKI